ncbi:MAG: hypothetical protein ABIG20_00610 [archaeon]
MDLNDPRVNKYEEFNKTYPANMSALLNAGGVPMSISDIMERRVEVLEKFKGHEVVDNWWDNYFYSCTGVAQFGDRIKVVERPKLLLEIGKHVKSIKNGALQLPKDAWGKLGGEGFSYNELKNVLNKPLSASKVLKHPIWNAVAGKEFLEKYIKVMGKKYRFKEFMGVYLDDPKESQNNPTLRAFVLGRGGDRWSDLYGFGGSRGLGDYGARLVGVLAEAKPPKS